MNTRDVNRNSVEKDHISNKDTTCIEMIGTASYHSMKTCKLSYRSDKR